MDPPNDNQWGREEHHRAIKYLRSTRTAGSHCDLHVFSRRCAMEIPSAHNSNSRSMKCGFGRQTAWQCLDAGSESNQIENKACRQADDVWHLGCEGVFLPQLRILCSIVFARPLFLMHAYKSAKNGLLRVSPSISFTTMIVSRFQHDKGMKAEFTQSLTHIALRRDCATPAQRLVAAHRSPTCRGSCTRGGYVRSFSLHFVAGVISVIVLYMNFFMST